MSKKKREATPYTPEEEKLIASYLPQIQSESGRYKVSTNSASFQELTKQLKSRTAMSVNFKVRSMMEDLTPDMKLFSFDDDQPELPAPPTTICDAIDKVLREFYGEVDYDTFIRFQEHLNKFQ